MHAARTGATCGEDRWRGVVPPEMFGKDTGRDWRGPLEVPAAPGRKSSGLIDYSFLETATCAAGPALDRAPGGGGTDHPALIIFNNVHVNFFKLLHPGNVPSTQRAII